MRLLWTVRILGPRGRATAACCAAALLAVLGVLAWAHARQEPYPPNLRGVIVAVDPGHGGVDGGAVAPDRTSLEKHLTLQLAMLLRAELEEAGAVVVLTREGDHDPSHLPWRHPQRYRKNLEVRLQTGIAAGAQAFVSLHMDTSRVAREVRRGPNTFYGTRGAQAGAGRALAEAIQASFHSAFGVSAKAYPLNVYVLRENSVPAALVECAFLNNPEDLARIRDPAYQRALVRAMVVGIAAFVRATPGRPVAAPGAGGPAPGSGMPPAPGRPPGRGQAGARTPGPG
jgi:N-acetylmuramoyl-L-alanine amidase